jgi:hypothetical protein
MMGKLVSLRDGGTAIVPGVSECAARTAQHATTPTIQAQSAAGNQKGRRERELVEILITFRSRRGIRQTTQA